MDIDAMHQKLADDEVVRNADEFHTVVTDALHAYTWVVESVEDCHNHLDRYNEDAAALLKEVHESAAEALDTIEDACADFKRAFDKLAKFAWPMQARDIYRMAILDAIHLHGGSSFSVYIPETVKALLGPDETAWPAAIGKARCQLEEAGLMTLPAAGVLQLTEKGKEVAEKRAKEHLENISS